MVRGRNCILISAARLAQSVFRNALLCAHCCSQLLWKNKLSQMGGQKIDELSLRRPFTDTTITIHPMLQTSKQINKQTNKINLRISFDVSAVLQALFLAEHLALFPCVRSEWGMEGTELSLRDFAHVSPVVVVGIVGVVVVWGTRNPTRNSPISTLVDPGMQVQARVVVVQVPGSLGSRNAFSKSKVKSNGTEEGKIFFEHEPHSAVQKSFATNLG
ncbi:hypothetical protein T08_938 [Trichinella sp. T8]|nr:hypothetical protein T08_938 [Trichinella sp. T8]